MKKIKFILFSLLLLCITLFKSNGQSKIIIKGHIDQNVKSDTLTLLVLSPYGNINIDGYIQASALASYQIIPKKGNFKFIINNHPIFYFKLFLSSKRDQDNHLLDEENASDYLMASNGDDIKIHIANNKWTFSGKGGPKNDCLYTINKTVPYLESDLVTNERQFLESNIVSKSTFSTIAHQKLSLLESYKRRLNRADYDQIRADFIGTAIAGTYRFAQRTMSQYSNGDSTQKQVLKSILKNFKDNFYAEKIPVFDNAAASRSRSYAYGLFWKEKAEYTFDTLSNGPKPVSLYRRLNHKYHGALRDRLITYKMKVDNQEEHFSDSEATTALHIVKDRSSKQYLNYLINTFGEGQAVNDFAFRDSLNNPVKLSDFKGKVVLVDMWYTGCGACIHVNEALHPLHDKLKNENVVFVSISIDKNRKTWISSVTKSPIDPNSLVGRYYPAPGSVVLYTGGTGSDNGFVKQYDPSNAYPKLLLIGKDGKIYAGTPPRPGGEPDQLLAMIQTAIAAK